VADDVAELDRPNGIFQCMGNRTRRLSRFERLFKKTTSAPIWLSEGIIMGSVSSTNPGITALLQTLSTLNSPVMSSPGTLSALESASPSDIVSLSDAASQLQGMSELFGLSDGSSGSSSASNLNYLLAGSLAADSAQTSSAATSSTTPSASSSATNQLANY
jgi:hypothetical protein